MPLSETVQTDTESESLENLENLENDEKTIFLFFFGGGEKVTFLRDKRLPV